MLVEAFFSGISSSAACYKSLLEDSGRQKLLFIIQIIRLMDNKSGKTISKDAFEVKVNYIR